MKLNIADSNWPIVFGEIKTAGQAARSLQLNAGFTVDLLALIPGCEGLDGPSLGFAGCLRFVFLNADERGHHAKERHYKFKNEAFVKGIVVGFNHHWLGAQ